MADAGEAWCDIGRWEVLVTWRSNRNISFCYFASNRPFLDLLLHCFLPCCRSRLDLKLGSGTHMDCVGRKGRGWLFCVRWCAKL